MNTTPERSYYVDWLRVLAVLALFPFHAGQIYSDVAFYVKAESSIPAIIGINAFIYLWHMPLFMILSGMASCYALRVRSAGQYLFERIKRLLVPLVFGILVLIPPLTYLRMFGDPDTVWPGGFAGNAVPGFSKTYLQYYPDFFNGVFPNGNFEWGHLWFLAYLLTFSVIALPVFLHVTSAGGGRVLALLRRFLRRPPAILMLFVPVAVIELVLRRAYPNMQNLVSDWANVLMFFTVFVSGFLIASEESFGEAIDKIWKAALTGGLLITVSMSVVYAGRIRIGLSETTFYVVEMILRGISIWFCLIGFLGFGRRFLNRGGRFIRYAREAALPVYIIHLPVVAATGFAVTKLAVPAAVGFVMILVVSLILTVLLHEVAVRRFNPVRFLFGLRKRG